MRPSLFLHLGSLHTDPLDRGGGLPGAPAAQAVQAGCSAVARTLWWTQSLDWSTWVSRPSTALSGVCRNASSMLHDSLPTGMPGSIRVYMAVMAMCSFCPLNHSDVPVSHGLSIAPEAGLQVRRRRHSPCFSVSWPFLAPVVYEHTPRGL